MNYRDLEDTLNRFKVEENSESKKRTSPQITQKHLMLSSIYAFLRSEILPKLFYFIISKVIKAKY